MAGDGMEDDHRAAVRQERNDRAAKRSEVVAIVSLLLESHKELKKAEDKIAPLREEVAKYERQLDEVLK